MTEDFITLEEYAKCIQKCLVNTLHDNQMAKDERPVVVYANAPIAYAKAQEHFKNGSNVGPLITFYQSGIEVDHSVQMGAWKNLAVVRDEGNYLYKAPIICKINYTVTINALTELQADLLQVQLMQATPFHRPYYDKFNGQFVLIESTDYRNLGTVDVGENKDKIAQREVILTIDRAYLNYDIKELNAGSIAPSIQDSSYDIDNPGDGRYVTERLKNGEVVYNDASTSGKEIKNTSMDGFAPYIYNVLDENGKIIDVTQKGKVRVTVYSLEGVKK